MQIADIYKLEYERTLENINKIFLIKDSANSPWYKAYEWSAFILEFFNKELEEKQRLHPTHRQYEKMSLINVGLQLKSLQKFLPNVLIEIDEKLSSQEIITISINLDVPQEMLKNFKDKISTWKDTVPAKKGANIPKNANANVYSQPTTFLSIMKEVVAYSYYDKSQEQLIQFIDKLKSNCANLIC